MSTRACVIIKDEYGQLIFYRHSDGYPEGVSVTLNKFIELLRSSKIRNNVSQAAGWLIILGAAEHNITGLNFHTSEPSKALHTPIDKILPYENTGYVGLGWKVGAYEPTTGIHGDIEFLYEIDLEAKTLTGWTHDGENKGAQVEIPGYEAPTNKIYKVKP